MTGSDTTTKKLELGKTLVELPDGQLAMVTKGGAGKSPYLVQVPGELLEREIPGAELLKMPAADPVEFLRRVAFFLKVEQVEFSDRSFCALLYLGHPSLPASVQVKLERGSVVAKRGKSQELWLTASDHETLTAFEPPRWKITETAPPEDPNRSAAAAAKKKE